MDNKEVKPDLQVEKLAQNLSAESYRSIPRIFLDLLLWIGAATLAIYFHRWWFTAGIVFLIGFAPFAKALAGFSNNPAIGVCPAATSL